MVECKFCGETVAMPYTCKLCGNKFCGKHRLPEKHECVNLGYYKTAEYKQQKRLREIEFQAQYSEVANEKISISPTSNMWQMDKIYKNVLLGGLILTIVAIVLSNQYTLTSILGGLFFMPLMFFSLYYVRDYYARKHYAHTDFYLYPIGIAITFLSMLLNFIILAFGFFTEPEADEMLRSKLVKISIITSLTIFAVAKYMILPLMILFTGINSFWLMIIHTSQMMLWLAIIYLIPWGGSDTRLLFELERNNYWKLLAMTIIIFFVDRIYFYKFLTSLVA